MPSWWSLAGKAMAGSARAGNAAGRASSEAFASRQLERLPRRVASRGYLAPGDPSPPPGSEILDYRGLMTTAEASAASYFGPEGVALGAVVDLDRSRPSGAFRVGVPDLFRHLCVVAPPGAGKTFGVIAPLAVRLLRAGATVVLLDVTGNLPEELAAFRSSTAGQAPTRVSSYHWSLHPRRGRHAWNPLAGVFADDAVAIEGLKAAVMGDEPPDPKHRDFHDRDVRVFGGLLKVALATQRNATLADVASLAADRVALQRSVDRVGPHLRYAVADLLEGGDGLWGIQNKLEPFLHPEVAAATSRSDFDLEEAIRGHALIVVGAELELRQRSQIGSALFVNRLIAHLQGDYGARDRRPVILIIDEAPEINGRVDLAGILATARGARTGVVLAAQNVTQFGDERESSSLLDNCDGMLLLPGASKASVEMFKTRLGQRTVERRSVGQDAVGWTRNLRVESSSEVVDSLGDRELLDPPFSQHPAIFNSRRLGTKPIALDLGRGVLGE